MDLIDFYILNTELIKLRLYLVLKKYYEKKKMLRKMILWCLVLL